LLAHALLAGGHPDMVVNRFGADALLPEASPYLVMLVARSRERLGDRAGAAPLLARALAGRRAAPVVLALRSGLPQPTAEIRLALLAGDRADVRKQAYQLRTRFPASADVASLAGDALLGAGDLQAALDAYARASEARRPWRLTRKAVWTYARGDDREFGELLLARHVEGEPAAASAVIDLAGARAKRGDWGRTALLIDQAVLLGAGHDPALLGLGLRAARALGKHKEARRFAALLAEVSPRAIGAR
jgi:Tfp pilus assembly protein PilF